MATWDDFKNLDIKTDKAKNNAVLEFIEGFNKLDKPSEVTKYWNDNIGQLGTGKTYKIFSNIRDGILARNGKFAITLADLKINKKTAKIKVAGIANKTPQETTINEKARLLWVISNHNDEWQTFVKHAEEWAEKLAHPFEGAKTEIRQGTVEQCVENIKMFINAFNRKYKSTKHTIYDPRTKREPKHFKAFANFVTEYNKFLSTIGNNKTSEMFKDMLKTMRNNRYIKYDKSKNEIHTISHKWNINQLPEIKLMLTQDKMPDNFKDFIQTLNDLINEVYDLLIDVDLPTDPSSYSKALEKYADNDVEIVG